MDQIILDQATQEERVAIIAKALKAGYHLMEYGPRLEFRLVGQEMTFTVLPEDIEYMAERGMIERDRAN